MKGFGDFFVLIFLFFCFVRGIGSVVAGIRNIFTDKRHASVRPDSTGKSMNEFDESHDGAFERLLIAGKLHQSGFLIDEEFLS